MTGRRVGRAGARDRGSAMDGIEPADDRQPGTPPGAGRPAPGPGESRPLPAQGRPGPAAGDGGGLPFVAPDGDGLRWSFELDLVSALEAIGRPLRDWDGVDQEEDLAAESAAGGFTDVPPGPAGVPPGPVLPGAAAGAPPPGPGADL